MNKTASEFLNDVIVNILEKLAAFDPFGREVQDGVKPERVNGEGKITHEDAAIPGPAKSAPAKPVREAFSTGQNKGLQEALKRKFGK